MSPVLEKVLAAGKALADNAALDDPAPGDSGHDDQCTAMLLEACDASLDEACRLFGNCDLTHVPPEVRQGIALAMAANVVMDGLVDDLNLPDPDSGVSRWVEATALDVTAIALADGDSDAKKPYGDVTYADPGYQSDGKKRYPVDTEAHARAAWSYINQGDNASAYSSSQLSAIKARIKSACSKFGISVSDASEKAAATDATEPVALAAGPSPAYPAVDHRPLSGLHSHMHMHDGDNWHPGADTAAMAAGISGEYTAVHHAPFRGIHSHAHLHASEPRPHGHSMLPMGADRPY